MATSKNDITGDTLKSKATSELYRNNYDAIFSRQIEAALCGPVAKAPTRKSPEGLKTPNTVKTLK